jgi:antibiotic biosynthesis monooxygenase (ABM) superfamily enzyme
MLLEVQHLLQDGEEVEIKTGLEFWCSPPDSEQKRAKPYKQFLIRLSVMFPLTMLVPWLLTPLFRAATVLRMPGISHFLVAGIVVAEDLRSHAPLHTAYGSLAIPLKVGRRPRVRSMAMAS